ncbi:MAG: hybrid sensor histidine kinase/response regulator, partial [Candidatus Aenigmarchaeota archaeon]|nr:hybrid sensor histidine kinase/response regulator [Candidatus Aenigmarchaeota archaeon]
MLLLLNDLLDLSKLEAGKLEYNFKSSQLSNIVKSVLREFETQIKEKEILIDHPKPGFDDTVSVDRGRIKQVIRNILSNAIKFSTNESRIVLDYTNQQQSLLFSVVDFG